MTLTVDANWLLSCLEDQDIVILDCRGIMPYKFGHIKNAIPLGLERVISVAKNGANLVIDAKTAEQVFTRLGIDSSKTVVVYGEYPDPSVARIAWTLIYHGQQNVKLLKIAYSDWHKLRVTNRSTKSNSKTNSRCQFCIESKSQSQSGC